jgi:hypothetical protein
MDKTQLATLAFPIYLYEVKPLSVAGTPASNLAGFYVSAEKPIEGPDAVFLRNADGLYYAVRPGIDGPYPDADSVRHAWEFDAGTNT